LFPGSTQDTIFSSPTPSSIPNRTNNLNLPKPITGPPKPNTSTSINRFNELKEIEALKSNLTSKIEEIIKRESTIVWGTSEISIPNLKFDHTSKLKDFLNVVREIDLEFHQYVSALEKERKERINDQMNRIVQEVRDHIRKEKGLALNDFVKTLENLQVETAVSTVNSPNLVDSDIEISPGEPIEEPICTICQDVIIRSVCLPCRHCFCFECMKEYAKDKIDCCEMKRLPIEDLIISCPNCKCPHHYLDEFDIWLTQNGYDVPAMWGL